MLSILIIDDAPEKVQDFRSFFEEILQNSVIHTATDKRQALRLLRMSQYDLVLLDLYLPAQFGDTPKPENGIELLDLIMEDDEINIPVYLIGTSRLDDFEKYKSTFERSLCFLLKYKEGDDSWKTPLKRVALALDHTKQNYRPPVDYDYDVAIINALMKENEILKKTLSAEWKKVEGVQDGNTSYFSTIVETKNGTKIRCVTAVAPQMGSVASATLTSKIINHFHPRYVFMTGIAAAFKDEAVNLGDILVASEVYDAGSGKIKEDTEQIFQPDPRHIILAPEFMKIIQDLQEDDKLLNEIYQNFPKGNTKPSTYLKIHTNPMITSSAVVSSLEWANEVKSHSRKLLGVEMEAYGMMFAATYSVKPTPQIVASIKSVSDYADSHKSDDVQEYASYTSAALLKHIITDCLEYKKD